MRVFHLLGSELPTVHDGHHEIEQDEAGGRLLRADIERFASVGILAHDVAFELEDLRESLADVVVVLDDEDVARTRHGRSQLERERSVERRAPFCSLVPTVMRSPSRSAGVAKWRTRIPLSRSAR